MPNGTTADCGFLGITCAATDAAGSAASAIASGAADGTLDSLSHAMTAGLVSLVASLGTAWVKLPTPDLATFGASGDVAAGSAAPGSGSLLTVLGWISAGGMLVAMFSLGLWAAMFAWSRRTGEGGTWTRRVLFIFFGSFCVTGAGGLVRFLVPSAPSAGTGIISFISNSTWFITLVVAAISVVIGSATMAIQQRAEPGIKVVRGIFTLVVVSVLGVPAIGLLANFGDGFSTWILNSSMKCDGGATGTCFARNIALLMPSMLTPGQSTVATFLMAFLTGVALVVFSAQMFIMIIRLVLLILLVGLFPLAAAASGTDTGRIWLRRQLGWVLAWVLYKPVAALIYAAAFRLSGTPIFADDGSGTLAAFVGLALLGLAIVALPVMVKFAAPALAALGGSGGGAEAAAAAVALPTGAVSLSREALKANSGGAEPPAGAAPSGPSSMGSGPGSPDGSAGGPAGPPSPRSSPEGGGGGGGAGGGAAGGGGGGGATPASASAAGAGTGSAAASGVGAGAAGGGAAAGGASAGAAGGPVGMAAGAVVGEGISAVESVAKGAAGAARSAAADGTAPSGSGGVTPAAASGAEGDLPDGAR